MQSVSTDLRVFWGSSYHYGSCNNCSRYATPSGNAVHQVLNINLGSGSSFRLCAPCLRELQEQIKTARKPAD